MRIDLCRVTTLVVLALAPVAVFAQGTDSPAPLDDPNSAMPTLDDLYNRLATGADYELRTTFVEPSAGPGATGHSLQEVMDAAPAADDDDGAAPADVLSGATYWGLRTDGGGWGQRTGTAPPAPVGRTGQTFCFNASGSFIPCAGTGQDGDLQRGVTRPNPQFTDNSDGTVTDNLTGLVWLRSANCDGTKTWAAALTWANGLYDGCASCGGTNNDCGLTDGSAAGEWRLPNRFELESLLDLDYFSPALSNTAGTASWSEGDAFSAVQNSIYWSSTTYWETPYTAWWVGIDNGPSYNGNKTTAYYVWPVRDPQ